jgi:predicted nucleic acid-binding protein
VIADETVLYRRQRVGKALFPGRRERMDESVVRSRGTPEVIERSLDMARICALRGADCAQLASAIALKELVLGAEFALVTSDRELQAAAVKTGIIVIDPQEEETKTSAQLAL